MAASIRDFYRCSVCDLIFVPPQQFLPDEEEKAYYDFHQNNPQDSGYRRFLGKLQEPMLTFLKADDVGLDFGSGPGPTLSVMFQELGYDMDIYDVIYARDDSIFEKTYDFITTTETVEHFRYPHTSFLAIWNLLKQGGFLGIMTEIFDDKMDFSQWHYKNDPTHICFYSRLTMEWLVDMLQADPMYEKNNITILKKKY